MRARVLAMVVALLGCGASNVTVLLGCGTSGTDASPVESGTAGAASVAGHPVGDAPPVDACFACPSGTKLPPLYLCDDFDDCADGSDEAGCGSWEYLCASGEAIPWTAACDTEVDCADGSDEHGCINARECQ
jgi:hypothetical protein